MNRKKFLKKGILVIGSVIAIPTMISSCKKDNDTVIAPTACATSPSETTGR